MAKGAAAALSCVIRGLPRWVVEEHAQVCEVVRIQMLLLFAEWRELSGGGVLVPGAVPLLGFRGQTSIAMLILPDRTPRFQKAAGDSERVSNRTRQQLRKCLLLFSTQVVWATQEQSAVQPQVLAYLANLVPIAPGLRRWLERRRRTHGLN